MSPECFCTLMWQVPPRGASPGGRVFAVVVIVIADNTSSQLLPIYIPLESDSKADHDYVAYLAPDILYIYVIY
jgi:hypothetical protein